MIAVASLGLGIGGATAVFTLVNAVVLRTLPVPEPHQLFQAQSHAPGQDYGGPFSAPMFDQLRAEVAPRGVELFAATGPNGVNLQPAGEAIQARGSAQLVSGEYFSADGCWSRTTIAPSARTRSPSSATATGGVASTASPTRSAAT